MKIRATLCPPLTVCALLLLAGCGRVQGQFIIVQNQVPQTGCTVTGDVSAFYRPEGFLDVSIVSDQATAGYLIFPLLENDLPGVTAGQTVDGNRIALAGWHVHLSTNATPMIQGVFDDPGNQSFIDYTVPTSGSVASGGGHTPSSVDSFPPDLARLVRNQGELTNTTTITVDATIHAIGNTINGSIQSDDFHYPITVCDGCLVANTAMCPFRATPTNPGNPCNPAQDDPVDCCTMSGKQVCPPLVSQ